MSSGCRLILKLDFSVDELLAVQKSWHASGRGSLKEYARDLLLNANKATSATDKAR